MKMTQRIDNRPGTFAGLGVMIALIAVALLLPLIYFMVQLALGNADWFAVNGYK